MSSKSRPNRYALVVWVVVVALVLSAASSSIQAQDGEEELTFEELQEQRETATQELADAAASIDATSATIEEIASAIDDVAALATIHQVRLEEATDRYASALGRLNQAEASQEEVLAEIDVLRVLVGELALAQFTVEPGTDISELVLSTDPGQSARLAHVLELQTGNAQDAMDRLRLLEFEADELVAERAAASSLAEESLAEMQHRSRELDAAISGQEQLLEAAQLRLLASESDAEAAALLIEETEERLLDYVRGIGAPAPVDRADIVTISFFEGLDTSPFFQIQVHKDIEEQTRGLYELAFSQGINLGGWGFRTTDRQIGLRRAHCGSTDYDIWLRPASQCSPPTARPGYSKHEQGRAIDFQWNGGSIGPRSGIPFQWLAANAPQFGFVNLPSEPWHWSDGTASSFDPTTAIPDFPQDTVPEVEPDQGTIELLEVPLDEEGNGEVGEEVVVEIDDELGDPESEDPESEDAESGDVDSGEVDPDGTAPPETLASTNDAASAERPEAESAADVAPVDEESNATSPDEPRPESEAPAENPDS